MNRNLVVLIVIGLLVISATAGIMYSRNNIMETSSNATGDTNVSDTNERRANTLYSSGVVVGDTTYRLENYQSLEQARLVAVKTGQPSEEVWTLSLASLMKNPRDFLVYAQLNTQYDIDNIYIGIRYFDPSAQTTHEYKEIYYQIDRKTGTVVKELEFPPVYQ